MKLLEFLDVFGFSGICSLAETEGFEYAHFSVGISDFQRSTHVRTHEVVYEF
jgi:hypothetical protein